jgi:hypothetical protein
MNSTFTISSIDLTPFNIFEVVKFIKKNGDERTIVSFYEMITESPVAKFSKFYTPLEEKHCYTNVITENIISRSTFKHKEMLDNVLDEIVCRSFIKQSNQRKQEERDLVVFFRSLFV